MISELIPFKATGYFSKLICDYLNEDDSLKPFYHRFPAVDNFKFQIEEKHKSFTVESRQIISKALLQQYNTVDASQATLANIKALAEPNCFTVTTGHQLNLFTGPLYFLYKIISTINLTTQLQAAYPDYKFVPVYWMATEDHDFEEINYFNFKGKKIQWNRDASGAVGELSTEGLDAVFNVFASQLPPSENAKTLQQLFTEAYIKHNTLAEATLYLANTLFKAYGLVIIDANTKALKQQFIPYIKNELQQHTAHKHIMETSKGLPKMQVNPREINLFYLTKNLRERIVFDAGEYKVLNTNLRFTPEQLLDMVEQHPERFSPNAIMRPLYQEVILPNLCYIGGGGELAYWLQLKDYFNAVNVPFPILLLRNSVLIQTEKQAKKLERLGISLSDRFLKQNDLVEQYVKRISEVDIDFTPQKEHLQQQFKDLYTLAEQTELSFKTAVAAQERKQIKGLEHLEKRLLRAQKRQLSDEVKRLKLLQNQLFPNQSLQERQTNFSEFYLEYGEELIPTLIEVLKPLSGDFTVLTL